MNGTDLRKLSDAMLRVVKADVADESWSTEQWLSYFNKTVDYTIPISRERLVKWCTEHGIRPRLEVAAREERHRGYHGANVTLFAMDNRGGFLDFKEEGHQAVLAALVMGGVVSMDEAGELHVMSSRMVRRHESLGLPRVLSVHIEKAREMWMC